MSTNSVQFEKAYITTPKTNLFPHELNGRVRSIYANITVSEELDNAQVKIINMVKLPANAVITKMQLIVVSGLASAGVLQLGYSAGESYEAADLNAFSASIDPTSAVNLELDLNDAAVGMLPKRFQEEVNIVISSITTSTVAMLGDVIKLAVEYVID